jgi:8-oxo-dGTP diphosphatase
VASTKRTAPSTHTYRVSPRVLIFAQYLDQVLLLKGAPNKPLWPDLYNGVGGHVEPGETVRDAATRELAEETGILSNNMTLCGMVNVNLPQPSDGVMLFLFTCHVLSSQTQSTQEGTLQWFKWDQLPSNQVVEDLPTLLRLVRTSGKSHQPFYALYTYNEAGTLKITLTKTNA